ncbi:MAG: hypothetical protein F4Y81_05710 [Rhodothermaceae bacterium]|nr:hypothetical protein [Rhodothermaceae bacterium]MYE62776.1 hypothetical protein [Rhodothermaceae bacterium]MYG70633.1 hypothetical protein [Rhodothermaceae bacterium]MYJ20539.1 hypothetical protein [Rhodothermaceae bacterium]
MPSQDEKKSGNITIRSSELEARLDRLDRMMDEPCANPRYGGLTLREAVRKQFLNEDAEKQKSRNPKK